MAASTKQACADCKQEFTRKTLNKYDKLRCKRCFDKTQEIPEYREPQETPQARGLRLEDEIELYLVAQAPSLVSLREQAIHHLYGDAAWGIDHLIYDEHKVAYIQDKATKNTLLPQVNHFIRAVQYVHRISEHSEKPFLALWASTCEPTEGAVNAFYQVTKEDQDFRFLTGTCEDLPLEVTEEVTAFFYSKNPPEDLERKINFNEEIETQAALLLSELPPEDVELLLVALEDPRHFKKLLNSVDEKFYLPITKLSSLVRMETLTS